jgi:nitrite reductase/ring-hydroxylating ferredoxin subunit
MGLRSRLKDGLRRVILGPPPPLEGPPSVRGESGWTPLCPEIALQEGKPRRFAVHGRTVAAFAVGRDVYVLDDACAHEDGSIGEGRQEGHIVACPCHGWRYDVRDGACLTDPSRRLATCPVRIRDGWVLVGPIAASGERSDDHAE